MPDTSTRQIFLPNYKININVPADYSDDQIADAVQRNKAQIQKASPVFAQGQQFLQNALGPGNAGNGLQAPGLGITEQQARAQGVGPAVQAAQDAAPYSYADQAALKQHYAAVRAINSANQHPNAAQIVAQAQAQLLPPERLAAITGKATRDLGDAVSTPLLNHVLDLGAPGASRQLEGMQGYGAGLARGALGFSSPLSLGMMAVLGPVAAEPMAGKLLLGAFGAPSAAGAYQRAQSGDVGGALGELTAFGLPFAGHLGGLAQDAVNTADYRAGARWMDANYGVDADAPLPPLLPSGPDPNVYEADFRPDAPLTSVSSDLALSSGRAASLPQIASAFPAAEGFGVDPTGNLIRQTLGADVPVSPGAEPLNLPADLVPSRYSSVFSDYGTLDLASRLGDQVRYRPSGPTLPNSITLLPAADLVTSGALVSASPNMVLPLHPPSVPLSISGGESQALSSVLGEQHPFATMMEELFADGRTSATIPVTESQLTALRSLAEQTTNASNNGSNSYSRATFLKRINTASQSLPLPSEADASRPQISDAATGLGQQLNAATTPAVWGSIQSESHDSNVRQRTRFDALQRQNDDMATLARLESRLGDTSDNSGSELEQKRVSTRVDTGLGGAQIRNGRSIITPIDNATATLGTGSGAPSVVKRVSKQTSRKFFEQPTTDEPTNFGSIQVKGTEAEGHLSAEWYDRYLDHVRHGTLCDLVTLQDVLQGETLRRAKYAFRHYRPVLDSPIVMFDDLDDQTGARIAPYVNSPSRRIIALNGRTWFAPEDMIFVLAEEAMHIAHRLGYRPLDFSHEYEQRRHEVTAKKGASYVSGRAGPLYLASPVR